MDSLLSREFFLKKNPGFWFVIFVLPDTLVDLLMNSKVSDFCDLKAAWGKCSVTVEVLSTVQKALALKAWSQHNTQKWRVRK